MVNNQYQVTQRFFDVFECLCQSEKPLGPSEISRRLGINKSTVYRFLAAMATRGYAERKTNGTYTLGYRMVEQVSCYLNNLELVTEARPYLTQLTNSLGLTSHLGVLDKREVVYVEKLDTLPGSRLATQIGYRVPAHCSSLGKCLLSGMSGDELSELYENEAMKSYTTKTLTELPALKTELKEVRAAGFAVDDQEFEEGHRCIAAPVYDYRGEIIAAVSASGTTMKLTDEFRPVIIAEVKKAAHELSRRLGYTTR